MLFSVTGQSKKKRGGYRRGSGKKPLLKPDQKEEIGIECVWRWYKLAEEKKQERRGLHDQYKLSKAMAARQQQVRQRLALGELSKQDAITDLEQYGASTFREHPRRHFRIKGTRPYRNKQAVLASIAEWASSKFMCRISARMVKTAWDEYLRDHRDIEDRMAQPDPQKNIV